VLGLGALEYAVLAPATLAAGVVVLIQSISSSMTLPWITGVRSPRTRLRSRSSSSATRPGTP
jgi:hypothetical protein